LGIRICLHPPADQIFRSPSPVSWPPRPSSLICPHRHSSLLQFACITLRIDIEIFPFPCIPTCPPPLTPPAFRPFSYPHPLIHAYTHLLIPPRLAQNKANSRCSGIVVTFYFKSTYLDLSPRRPHKNKANSNPIVRCTLYAIYKATPMQTRLSSCPNPRPYPNSAPIHPNPTSTPRNSPHPIRLQGPGGRYEIQTSKTKPIQTRRRAPGGQQ